MNKQSLLDRSHQSTPSLMSVSTKSVSSVQRMKRRKAAVSKEYICGNGNINNSAYIEGGKSLKRRAMRRYAITKYSRVPLNDLKSLRKMVEQDHHESLFLENNISEKFSTDNQNRLIIFGLQDKIDRERPGSKQFLSLIDLYYREKYQFAECDTQRSILRSVILDEMKELGYKFVRKDVMRLDHFYLLDDFHAVQLIKAQLSLQKLKTTFCAHSA